MNEMSGALGALSIISTMTHEDDSQRQQNYTLELMQKQSEYNQKALEAQKAAQLDIFAKTGYEARVQQLKAAGLNPGLIYGMGAGGGGGVTGNISAPSVGLGSAPNVAAATANKTAQIGMALQLSKLQSEIEVNKSVADANRSTADANRAGIPLKGSETDLNISRKEGQDIDNQMKRVDLEIKQAVKDKDIQRITAITDKAVTDLNTALYQNASQRIQSQIDLETAPLKIQKFNAELAQTIADVIKTKAQSFEIQQNIIESINRIEQNWIGKEIDMEQIKAELQKTMMNNNTTLDAAELQAISHLLGASIQSSALMNMSKAVKKK